MSGGVHVDACESKYRFFHFTRCKRVYRIIILDMQVICLKTKYVMCLYWYRVDVECLKTVVTCTVKHLQNICKNVLELREVDGSKTHFTCNHCLSIQAVFCNIFANVLA